jgi:hypothetical protein
VLVSCSKCEHSWFRFSKNGSFANKQRSFIKRQKFSQEEIKVLSIKKKVLLKGKKFNKKKSFAKRQRLSQEKIYSKVQRFS